MRKLHRVLGTSRRHRAQRIDVAEHVGERHESPDHRCVAAHLLIANLTAPRVDVADDATDELARRYDFDVHDRLEQLDAGLLAAFLHRRTRRDFEGDGGRVHFVERAVVKIDLHVDHREADQDAVIPDRLNTLLDAGDVFLRDRTADD